MFLEAPLSIGPDRLHYSTRRPTHVAASDPPHRTCRRRVWRRRLAGPVRQAWRIPPMK